MLYEEWFSYQNSPGGLRLRNRIGGAAMEVAMDINQEVEPDKSTQPEAHELWTDRRNWAISAIRAGMLRAGDELFEAVMGENIAATEAQIDAVDDSVIKGNVESVVNMFATSEAGTKPAGESR